MESLTSAVSVLGASVLWLAAIAKLLAADRGTRELLRFGVPQSLGRLMIFGLCAFELLLGIAVLLLPGRLVASAIVITGATFAVLGITTHSLHIEVDCNCFGHLVHNGKLGLRQVGILPLWIGLAVVVWTRSPPSTVEGMWALISSSLILANVAVCARLGMSLWVIIRSRLETQGLRVAVSSGHS